MDWIKILLVLIFLIVFLLPAIPNLRDIIVAIYESITGKSTEEKKQEKK